MPDLEIKHLSDYKNVIAYVGSVENVIAGIIPDELKNKRFSASKVKYGFELGSPQDIYNMGECIIFNNLIYASRTDETRSDRDPMMWGSEFVTSGIFLIPHDTKPNDSVTYSSMKDEITLNFVYNKIYERIKKPFAIVGCAELSELRATAITASPIKGENIFCNKNKYYAEKEKNEKNLNIAFVGVAANMDSSDNKNIIQKLHTVLYENPNIRQPDNLTDHTHAVILSQPIINMSDILPHNVKEMVHLNDDSVIRYIKMDIYVINNIVEYIEN